MFGGERRLGGVETSRDLGKWHAGELTLVRDMVTIPVIKEGKRHDTYIRVSTLSKGYEALRAKEDSSPLSVMITTPERDTESEVDQYFIDMNDGDLWAHASYWKDGGSRSSKVKVDGSVRKLASYRDILIQARGQVEQLSPAWFGITRVVQLIDKSAKNVLGRKVWL